MNTKNRNHVHKYWRRKLKTSTVYACALPDCTHYLREELAAGKRTLCWKCGQEFNLPITFNSNTIRVKPICHECKLSKKVDKKDVEIIAKLVHSINDEPEVSEIFDTDD